MKIRALEPQKDIADKQHLKDLYSKSSLMCVYCTKLEPIFKTNDVARAERVVA
jgi:hypothetical protein